MEQFSRAEQATIDAYLAGKIGEAALIREGHAWPNSTTRAERLSRTTLMEFAEANHNAGDRRQHPKPLVSCIGQEGAAWLDKLPTSRRSQLARQLTLDDDPYRQKFMASMHHGDADSNARRFADQTSWDDTMAESMVDYLASHPGQQIMHIAGNFHVEGGLGIASRIASRNPALKVALAVPQTGKETAPGRTADINIKMMQLPERWQNSTEMRQDTGVLHQSRSRDCSQ